MNSHSSKVRVRKEQPAYGGLSGTVKKAVERGRFQRPLKFPTGLLQSTPGWWGKGGLRGQMGLLLSTFRERRSLAGGGAFLSACGPCDLRILYAPLGLC